MTKPTSSDLKLVYERRAFDPSPGLVKLSEFHVPFDDLLGSPHYETALERALRAGERVALIGGSGSGKSSMISHVLGPLVEGLAPLWIRVSIERPEVAADPAEFCRHVARILQRWLPRHLPSASHQNKQQYVTRRHKLALSAGLNWLGSSSLSYELSQVASEPVQTSTEAIEVVSAILYTIRSHDLVPVLVLDDTDKWLSLPDPETARQRRQGFFGSIVRLLGENLSAVAVIAVHPSYLRDDVYVNEARGFIGTSIQIPALPTVTALQQILQYRAQLALTSPGEMIPPSADALFDEDALDLLFEHYQAGPHSDIRNRVMSVAHIALTTAVDNELAAISRAVIESAIIEATPSQT